MKKIFSVRTLMQICREMLIAGLILVAPTTMAQHWVNLGSGVTGSQWGTEGRVQSLVIDTNGHLYAGGDFTAAGDVNTGMTGIAKWNGTNWISLDGGMNGMVLCLFRNTNSDVYAGGYFTEAGGVSVSRIAKWNGANWNGLGSGSSLETCYISSLVVATNGLYAGGSLSILKGIAKWDGASWATVGNGVNNYCLCLAMDANSDLYAGGLFTAIGYGELSVNYIAKWNGSNWTNLGNGLNGSCFSLLMGTNGDLYVGGNFTTAGGVSANYIAKWNGANWTNLGSGMNGSVYALAMDINGDLYAGGQFTTADNMSANYIAKWNGANWTNLGSGMNDSVYSLAVSTNGDLYAGGSFTNAGGLTANHIAKWTMLAPPSPPTGVSASDGTYTNKVQVSWVASSGATSYELWRHTSNSSNAASKISSPDPTDTSYDDTNAAAGTTYYYWVKTVNAGGASGFSASDSGFLGSVGPLITANGLVGDVVVNNTDPVTIAVQMMNIDPYLGVAVDWWIVALANGTSWYYLNSSVQWTPFNGNLSNCHPVYQGGLNNLPATEVLNLTGLSVGSYTFWFAVDYPMDGILDANGQLLFNSVNVVVQ